MVPASEADTPGKVMFFPGTATEPFPSSSPLGLSSAELEHLPADFQETRNVKPRIRASHRLSCDPLAKAGGMMLTLCGHLNPTQKAFLGPETSQPQIER